MKEGKEAEEEVGCRSSKLLIYSPRQGDKQYREGVVVNELVGASNEVESRRRGELEDT